MAWSWSKSSIASQSARNGRSRVAGSGVALGVEVDAQPEARARHEVDLIEDRRQHPPPRGLLVGLDDDGGLQMETETETEANRGETGETDTAATS
jgi:hypothetical protein